MAEPHPAMRAVLERLAAQRAGQPSRYALPYAAARAQLLAERRPWLVDGPACAHATIALDAGGREVPVRVYRPDHDGARHTLVYLHGGGWCVGSPETHDAIVRRLAVGLAAQAWSVDYRLAPEHPDPAGALDAVAAAVAAARARPGTAIVLAGDSAGAHLALDAARRLRDPGPSPIAALLLFYGVYTRALDDASMTAYGDGRYGLSQAAHARYLADTFGAVPARGRFALDGGVDLAGLPPAFVVAAELDVLRDQSAAFARALSMAGGSVELLEVPGMIHGFLAYGVGLPQVGQTLEAACAWCRRVP